MEMDEDAAQLILREIKQPPLLVPLTVGAGGLLFLLGAVFGILKYRYQLKR